jgi:para-nitrobenzyl esterase
MANTDHTLDAAVPVVTTSRGAVRGSVTDGISRFAGIPYAAPPVGERRFRPPAPPEPWEGELDGTRFGPVCPQNPSMMDLLMGEEVDVHAEDCLRLNVWTPDVSGSAPVMVWIHGGGFEIGSGSSPLYSGASFARDGVVLVSLNYRLGALGFLELGGLDTDYNGSANNGLLDQVMALQWVQREIAAFGGDANRVTIFGESAGSMSVSLLLTMPAARGLFHQAICQSGALNSPRTVEEAHVDTNEFLAEADLSSLDELLAAPVEQLLAAHAQIAAGRVGDVEGTIRRSRSPLGFLTFRPVADGNIVPEDPPAVLAAGHAANVSLLVGTNAEEWKLFALMSPGAANDDELHERLGLLTGDPAAMMALYRAEHLVDTPAAVECEVLTDLVFRVPTSRLADIQARHAPTFQYLFAWRSPSMGGMLGSSHAMEIPFVFDVTQDARVAMLVGHEPPVELAAQIHGAWVSFATNGAPSVSGVGDWQPVTPDRRPVMVFDTESEVRLDPHDKTLRIWDTSNGL